MPRQYWLIKQEPEAYSWKSFEKEGKTAWTGVRNFQARNNLRTMSRGDLALFYHSVSEKQIVGVAKVTREHFPDPTAEEGDWSAVEFTPVKTLSSPVTLEQIKSDPKLKDMGLVRQSRLSVTPVTSEQFEHILKRASTSLPAR